MNETERESAVARLRAAGCVFAEDEAALLLAAAAGADSLEVMLRRRETGEPLEHILGWVEFGGLRLAVGPGAFIPRQRSVRLARAAVRELRGRDHAVFVEAYAGVAPLAALVAARSSGVEVHAIELDPGALRLAARNLPDGVLHVGSRLAPLPASLRGRVDVIAAVPPYIPDAELDLLPRDFREHEPLVALTAGPDGLDEVRALLDAAGSWLAPGGAVLLELNRRQAPAAAAHARARGFHSSYRTASDGQTALLRAAHTGRRARPAE